MSSQATPTMSWQDQLVDVLRARERMWLVAALVLILLGALLALLAPGTLPPTPLVGLAVGAAAVLLATALVIGLDASDLIVRGPRHVAAAGGTVAGTISRSTADIDALVDLIDDHAAGGTVRVALTPASRSAGVPGSRANIVAGEMAARGQKVLVTDLTRGGTPAVGLSDVISGERQLGEAVRFDDELYLAHLAVGSEPERALEGFASWARGLPPDLDVLVAALPPLSEPGVMTAVQGVELVLLLVEVDRTERVDLIASLDAIDAAEVPAELVLVDDAVAAASPSGSASVEVLSTPGSTPRQRDPDGFDLREEGGATDGDVDLGHDQPDDGADDHDEDHPGTDPGTDADTPTVSLDRTDPEFPSGSTPDDTPEDRPDARAGAAAGGPSGAAGPATGVAPGAGAAGAAAGAMAAGAAMAGSRDRSDVTRVPGVGGTRGAADADRRRGTGDEPDARPSVDPSEFDDDEVPPPTEPGGGHVRTLRRRAPEPPPEEPASVTPPAGDDPGTSAVTSAGDAGTAAPTDPDATMAMAPVGLAGGSDPVVDDDATRDVGDTAAPETAAPETVAEPDTAVADDDTYAPVRDEYVDPFADDAAATPVAEDPGVVGHTTTGADTVDAGAGDDLPDDHLDDSGNDAHDDRPDLSGDDARDLPRDDVGNDGGDVSGEDVAGDDDEDDDGDPIDVMAREQARLSASLQQLAQDVWQRGDGQ